MLRTCERKIFIYGIKTLFVLIKVRKFKWDHLGGLKNLYHLLLWYRNAKILWKDYYRIGNANLRKKSSIFWVWPTFICSIKRHIYSLSYFRKMLLNFGLITFNCNIFQPFLMLAQSSLKSYLLKINRIN